MSKKINETVLYESRQVYSEQAAEVNLDQEVDICMPTPAVQCCQTTKPYMLCFKTYVYCLPAAMCNNSSLLHTFNQKLKTSRLATTNIMVLQWHCYNSAAMIAN